MGYVGFLLNTGADLDCQRGIQDLYAGKGKFHLSIASVHVKQKKQSHFFPSIATKLT